MKHSRNYSRSGLSVLCKPTDWNHNCLFPEWTQVFWQSADPLFISELSNQKWAPADKPPEQISRCVPQLASQPQQISVEMIRPTTCLRSEGLVLFLWPLGCKVLAKIEHQKTLFVSVPALISWYVSVDIKYAFFKKSKCKHRNHLSCFSSVSFLKPSVFLGVCDTKITMKDVCTVLYFSVWWIAIESYGWSIPKQGQTCWRCLLRVIDHLFYQIQPPLPNWFSCLDVWNAVTVCRLCKLQSNVCIETIMTHSPQRSK